jgi:hypothetical protein
MKINLDAVEAAETLKIIPDEPTKYREDSFYGSFKKGRAAGGRERAV